MGKPAFMLFPVMILPSIGEVRDCATDEGTIT